MTLLRLRLKHWFWLGLLCLSCLLTAPVSLALDVKDVPNPRHTNGGWVTDMAHLLKPGTLAQINQMISQLEANSGAELAVVTVAQTKPASSVKEFATTLFNKWHIGKRGLDNGVLLLVSKGDHRVEIETGYGVESILPDATVGQIISEQIIPRFKANDYDRGILEGTRSLVEILGKEYTSSARTDAGANRLFLILWFAWEGIVFVLAIIGIVSARHQLAIIDHKARIVMEPQGKSRQTLHKVSDFGSPQPPSRFGFFFLLFISLYGMLISLVGLAILLRVVFFSLNLSEASNVLFPLYAGGLPFGLHPSVGLSFFFNRLAKKREKRRIQAGYYRCARCQNPMEKVDTEKLLSALTPTEQVAQAIGSLTVEGWRCQLCQPELPPPGFYLCLYRAKESENETCPTCEEPTVTVSPIAVQVEPTWHREGRGVITKECQCCHWHKDVRTTLRRLAPDSTLFLKPGERSHSTKAVENEAYCAGCGKQML